MNGKKVLTMVLVVFAVAAMIAVASDERVPVANGRTDKDVVRQDMPSPAEATVSDEQVETQLEPGIAQIEEHYRERMAALKREIADARSEEMLEELQLRTQQLKVEWTIAIIDRHIELARESGDAEAEAREVAARQAILNPPAPSQTPVTRDPNADIHVERSAR